MISEWLHVCMGGRLGAKDMPVAAVPYPPNALF